MAPAPKIDISPGDLKIVLDILARQIPDREVWAFGSRATWKTKDFSDLDLAVIGDEPLSLKVSAALSDDFAESDLPFKVDVVDWATTSESFREIIRRDRVVVRGGRVPVQDLIDRGVLEVGDGYRAKNSELSATGLPFARAGNIDGGFNFADADHFPEENLKKVGSKVSRVGDVVFTSKGTVGRFASVTSDTQRFVYSPQLCYWRSLDSQVLDPSYLYYWMGSRRFMLQVNAVKGQTDMADYVSLTDQRRMAIDLPRIEVQRDLVSTLKPLDDKIGLNRRMNETMEAMARALFKSWFVDFDPDGSGSILPSIEQTPSRLSDMIELIGGGTPSTSMDSYWGGGIPWFSVVDAPSSSDVFVIGTEKTITQLGLDNSSTRMLPPYTTIVTARGTVGKLALTACPMTMNQSCYGIRGNSGRPPFFIYFLVRSCIQGLQARTHGSVFDTITRATFDAIEVIDPGVAAAEAFDSVVAATMLKIKANLEQSRTLAALRDLLLPRLLSGQLRIKDAEKMVADAV